MFKRLALPAVIIALVCYFGIPAFAQTQMASAIPGQPLSQIAASQIFRQSELPQETLPGNVINSLTRGRDAVNTYRYAHSQLSQHGWYKGISEDHTPLLEAMVRAMESQGYTSSRTTWESRKTKILDDFWFDSATQNVKEMGFGSLTAYNARLRELEDSGNKVAANLLAKELDVKWK